MEKLNIIQKEITTVSDNDINALGNKIKLKASSLINLMKHRTNVSYETTQQTEITKEEVAVNEDKGFSLVNPDFTEVSLGDSKPINVKPAMIENMIGNYSDFAKTEVAVEEEKPAEITEEPVNDIQPEIEMPVNMEVNVEEPISVQETVMPTIENPSIESTVEEDADVERMLEEVSNARQKLITIREEAQKAEEAANESERVAQEMGVQYTEAEKQVQEAELRSQEIKRKIVYELRNQLSTMSSEERQYASTIANANQRQEESQNKIIDFQTRIEDQNQRLTAINSDIAKDEEKYNALLGINNPEMEEDKVRRFVA